MRAGLSHLQEQTSNSKTKDADEVRKNSSPPHVSARGMKLRPLLEGTDTSVPTSAADTEIRQVTCDSRRVQPGALFFALHGAKADGNAFIRDAVSRGAAGIVSEDPAPQEI